MILTAAEKERDRRQRLANAKKEFLGVEKQKEVEKIVNPIMQNVYQGAGGEGGGGGDEEEEDEDDEDQDEL